MKLKRKLTLDEFELGILLTDPFLFTCHFWKDDLTVPKDRTDLPRRYRGRQIITLEQRVMMMDGAVAMLFYDTMPEEARKSSRSVMVRSSRKIGKTIVYESKYIQIAITNTRRGNTEGLMHAPGEVHLAPVLARIYSKIARTPLFKLLHLSTDRSSGIDRWKTGYTWHTRIEGTSGTGRNMVGLRAQHDIGDECDYGSEEAYNERMQTDLPSCFRYWGGVPRGVRGIAWRIAKTGEGANWSRHYNGKYARLRFDMRANILYHSKEAWNDQLRGAGYTDQRVRTQVLGLDGDVAISSFPVIPVNKDLPFLRGDIVGFDIEDDVRLDARTKAPWDKVGHYDRALLYGDYGYSPSPFILGIAYEKDGVWYQLARFRVIRAHAQNAAKLVAHLDRLAPRPFDLIVIDAHGRGAGVMETIHYDPRWESHNFRARAIDAGFGGSVQDKNRMIHKACRNLVRYHQTLGWLCDACGRVIYDESDLRPAMIPTKQVATVWLKEALAEGQQYLDTGELPYKIALVMANDEESILELSGTTEIEAESGVVRYITENGAEPHITDHWRAWAVGANRLIDMARGLLDEDVDQFGWVSIPQGRSDELVVAAMPDF